MATKIYEVHTFELQDGTEVTVRPLNIKLLREFMEIMQELKGGDDVSEFDNIEVLLRACALAFRKDHKKLSEDLDSLEEVLDIPTMWKIIEIAGGVTYDPNLLTEVGGAAGLT